MRAVLRDRDGNFFTRMGENKFYIREAQTSSDLQDATVFEISIFRRQADDHPRTA